MAQTIRLSITPEIEKALQVLRKTTLGTLNTTELIKMAVGSFAKMKEADLSSEEKELQEMDYEGAYQFYKWAKEDGSLNIDNIAHPDKLKPFTPKSYVRTR